MSRTLSRLPVTPPTLADVAERAGVSRQTVSNAVNNPELLRDDTLLRVQEAIAELGYLPNRAARNLRTRSSHLIGLPIKTVEEGTANAQMDRFVHSLVEASSAAGYHVLLFTGTDTGDPEDELPGYDDLLRSTAVDAFVVTDTYLGNPQVDWLNERRAPFVAFGRPWNDPEARHPWVDVDGAAGTELATTHLIDKGHQRIAWIGWRKESLLGEDRRSGWSRALRSRGLSTTGLASRVEDTVASGREASAVLLDEAAPLRVRLRVGHPGDGCAAHPGRARPARRPRHRGHRLRRLAGRPGRPARAHLGAAAPGGRRRRGRQGARQPARPADLRHPRRAAHPDAGRRAGVAAGGRTARSLRAVVSLRERRRPASRHRRRRQTRPGTRRPVTDFDNLGEPSQERLERGDLGLEPLCPRGHHAGACAPQDLPRSTARHEVVEPPR